MGRSGRSWVSSAVLVVIAAASSGGTARAQERYAVLVGVGTYANLEERLQLQGPPNDVALVREYLTSVAGFKDDNVVMLTDNEVRVPERAAILAELDRLRDRVTGGDFILLYFAGHGSRQPAGHDSEEELDGYDEIFLPADVGTWDRRIGAVENAIVDDEIAEVIDAYRKRGADVWAIFDSCHSGTMMRGVGDAGVRTRQVPPGDLGVPTVDRAAVAPGNLPAFMDVAESSAEGEVGALVGFFASHSGEETPEMALPRGAEAGEQEVYGLFSYNLWNALRRYPNASYRELAELILAEYAAMPHMQSTPQFYGTIMEETVFAGDGRPAVFRADRSREDLNRLELPAGRLRGFDEGAGVSLHRDAATEESMGIAVVTSATATRSTLAAQWRAGGEAPPYFRSVWARLDQPAYTPTVAISLLDTRRNADNDQLARLVGVLEAQDIPFVSFRPGDREGDYFAAFFGSRFWLLRPDQQLPCSVRPTEEESGYCDDALASRGLFWSTPEEAGDLVGRAARARNLVKLQAFRSASAGLETVVEIGRGTRTLSLSEAGRTLREGDRVSVSVANSAVAGWDLFFFYVDSTLAILPLQAYGTSARIGGGQERRLDIGTITTSTIGTESLVVIADPAGDGIEANYSFLAQEGLSVFDRDVDVGRGGRGGPASPLEALLDGIWRGDGSAAARSMEAAGGARAHIEVFTWTVEP